MIKIFADDTKIYSKIESVEDNNKLQASINSFINWSDKWLNKFNSSTCKELHLGSKNPMHQFQISENGGV